MSPFSPLYYIKQNKSRCILLMIMLMLSAVIYVGGLYVTSPPSTFDSAKEINEHCICMRDNAVINNRESRMDEFIAEIESDYSLDYTYRAAAGAFFYWDTLMEFSCGINQLAFGSVEDFKKYCEIFDIDVDFSNIKKGSLILSEMFANNLGLSFGDKIDESDNNDLINVFDECSYTVDYITDQHGYVAYMIMEKPMNNALYLYGKTISGEELKSKALAFEKKYDMLIDTLTTEEIEAQFSSFYFIYGFIVILVSVIIAITINTAFAGMYQKRNFEFAVYRAIGISKARILRKIISELVLIDGIVLISGSVLTMFFLYLFNNIVLYPDGIYIEYFHPLAIAGVIICNLLSLLPLILFRVKQIKKADICEY